MLIHIDYLTSYAFIGLVPCLTDCFPAGCCPLNIFLTTCIEVVRVNMQMYLTSEVMATPNDISGKLLGRVTVNRTIMLHELGFES